MTQRLQVERLTIAYGPTAVLADLTFGVAPGEVVGVVGPSGAGKSSLLLALCGLLKPKEGRIVVDGNEITTAPGRDRDRLRRQLFGFVFQSGELVPELTIAENVAMPLRLLKVPARTAMPRAHAALERLGIGHLGARMVHEVSGGQLQRAAIARATVHEPAVILADEPTGALDDDNARVVFDLFTRHAVAGGAAVLLVTHDRSLAAQTNRTIELALNASAATAGR